MKHRLLVIANIGFIIGIILGLYLKVSIILFLSIFVVGLIILIKFMTKFYRFKLLLHRLQRYLKLCITKNVILIFIIFLILGFAILTFKDFKFENFIANMEQNKESLSVYATIVSDIEEKEYTDVYKIKILNINNKNYSNTYCFIKLKKQINSNLKYGDLIFFKGKFQLANDRTNFKGYSYKEYLKTINVSGTFETTYNKVKVLHENNIGILYFLSNKAKNSLKRSN